MKKIISPITGKSKYLLIENSEVISEVKISKDLKESLKLSAGKAGTLIVKNLPGTILNRENQNGRIYSTEVLQEAINNAKYLLQSKQLLGQACEHPEGSFVSPTTASHVVTNAYIKHNVRVTVDEEVGNYDMLFMDIEVLNTEEGKNLRALLEAECSVGTSIRGVGDMEGRYVKNYEVLGIDFVGNPSSSTYTRMPVSESVHCEVKDSRGLDESYVITSSSTDVVHDLGQAAVIQDRLNNGVEFGTVDKTATKLETETDPKTGAETNITTIESETTAETSSLDQALFIAKKAMTNGVVNVETVTIENIPEENKKEATEEYVPEKEIAKTDKPMNEAKEDKEEDPNLGKKFVLHTSRGFVTFDKNAIDFTDKPEEALHFTQGKEEAGMVSMSKVTEILDAMGIFEVEKYFQKSITNLGEEPKKEGLVADDINLSIGDVGVGGIGSVAKKEPKEEAQDGAAAGKEMASSLGTMDGVDAGTIGSELGNNIEDNFGKITEENGSNTKYRADVMITGQNGQATEQIPVSAVDLEGAQKEISNLWEMKSKGNEGAQVIIKLVDTVNGDTLVYNSQTQGFDNEQVMPESVEDDSVEVKDDKVITKVDDDTDPMEKEFDSPMQAKLAAAAVEKGKVDPSVLLPEADVEEKLYTNPSEPSDELVKTPLKDAEEDLLVTLYDIDWDFDKIGEDLTPEDYKELVDILPDPWTIRLNAVDLEGHDDIYDIRKIILAKANEQAPWKINSAFVQKVEDANSGEVYYDNENETDIEPERDWSDDEHLDDVLAMYHNAGIDG